MGPRFEATYRVGRKAISTLVYGLLLSILLTGVSASAQSVCSVLFSPHVLVTWKQPFASGDREKFLEASDFYEVVYRNYEGTIRRELIEQLHAIDEELTADRTLMALIEDPVTHEIIGTFRIFDSAAHPWNPVSETAPSTDITMLPFERLNDRRHLSHAMDGSMAEAAKLPPEEMHAYLLKAWEKLFKFQIGQKFLRWLRTQNKFHIFEVGKLSLHGTAEQRDRARRAIEENWQANVLSKFPNGIFMAHVASKAHARHYKQLWGFEVAYDYDVVGNPDREYILWAPGWLISQHIRKNQGEVVPSLGEPPSGGFVPNDVLQAFRHLTMPAEFHGR